MAESLFILEIEFLHIRGGCSLVVVFFVRMLVGICCFILSAIYIYLYIYIHKVVYELKCSPNLILKRSNELLVFSSIGNFSKSQVP